jgi:hypothetical protein
MTIGVHLPNGGTKDSEYRRQEEKVKSKKGEQHFLFL